MGGTLKRRVWLDHPADLSIHDSGYGGGAAVGGGLLGGKIDLHGSLVTC